MRHSSWNAVSNILELTLLLVLLTVELCSSFSEQLFLSRNQRNTLDRNIACASTDSDRNDGNTYVESNVMYSSRRSILTHGIGSFIICTSTCIFDPVVALADAISDGVKQPYAPLENLLPATRVRVLIDKAVQAAVSLCERDEPDLEKRRKILVDLETYLLEPQEFMTKQEASTSKRYLEQKTWGDWKKARQKETMIEFELEVDPATQLNEAFEQWGERRQFKRLRRQQLALEKSNSLRAAFNAYTNNLVFGESYTLTASREEKSRMIRKYNALPDVTSVIRSDLDLRDLYRNQVLTAMDDAKAELEYQIKNSSGSTTRSSIDTVSFDATELLSTLKSAQESCSEWFNFVPENDATAALEVVRVEQSGA